MSVDTADKPNSFSPFIRNETESVRGNNMIERGAQHHTEKRGTDSAIRSGEEIAIPTSTIHRSRYRTVGGESTSLVPFNLDPQRCARRKHDGYQPFPEWLADVNEPNIVNALRESWDSTLPISINLGKFEFGIAEDLEEFVREVGQEWALKCIHLRLGLNMTRLAIQHPGREPCDETFDDIGGATGLETGAAWRSLGEKDKRMVARALRADNAVSALGVLVEHWLSEGHGAAGYLLACAEAAVRKVSISGEIGRKGFIVVDNILVRAQMERWSQSYDWTDAKFAAMFVMTLAASKTRVLEVSETIARRGMTICAVIKSKPSESLKQAVDKAKAAALTGNECTVIGVGICDGIFFESYEKDSDVRDSNITFAHWLVLGICQRGVRVWQAGGREGDFTLHRDCMLDGDALMSWEKAEDFVNDFEAFALPKGRWNKPRLKAYERVTGIDLRQARDRGTRKLLVDYEAWVELVVLEDVKRDDIAKFVWM